MKIRLNFLWAIVVLQMGWLGMSSCHHGAGADKGAADEAKAGKGGADKRPNILFVIADDQSYPYASVYGTTGIRTPAFDRVAGRGILFNEAFAAAPQCSPSRAALLTGKNIWQLEEAGTHSSYFPKKFPVFTDLLEGAGYTIGYTGKAWGPGNWKDAGWKRNPVGPEFNSKKLTPPASGISKIDYFGNFVDFYAQRKAGKPFFFWYGANEPHRVYEEGSGRRAGKDIRQSFVPDFLPDDTVVRSDIADYALEIEWFDRQLGRMIDFLREKGELENTIIVVTSDNGMPFPSAKANLTEYGSHVPMAISWPARVRQGAISNDLVSLIDLAPTFLQLAGITDAPAMTGKSLTDILLRAEGDGAARPHRSYVLTGRERHSHARPDDLGYPSRAIRTDNYLYIMNERPDRWPAGDPAPGGGLHAGGKEEVMGSMGGKKGSPGRRKEGSLERRKDGSMGGGGQEEKGAGGDFKPIGVGYGDIDDPSPTKRFMMQHQKDWPLLFREGFEKRPAEQLFDIKRDPGCTKNLIGEGQYAALGRELKDTLLRLLRQQGDPRALGRGDVFESYPRFGLMRNWPGFKERGKYNPAFMQQHD